MKKLLCSLLSLALVCAFALPVWGEEGANSSGSSSTSGNSSTSGTSTPTPVTPGQGVYVVAATVTDRAGGEISTVGWGDVVNVVLKVVDHSSRTLNVDPDGIAARVNSSVFTYTGLGEISQLYEGSDDGGDYYGYVLLFRDVIYNGGGNTFNVDLSYPDSSLPMQQFSVTLGQCVDKDPNDPSKARTPNLVVRESSYGTQEVLAGQPFVLTLTVYASTGTENLNDVIVALTLPEHVSLTGGSLSAYVGGMSPKSTRQVSFSVLPSASFTNGVANIGVQMTGTGALSGTAATGSTTISVPITQPDRFEIGELQLDEPLMAGSTASVSLSYVNKGKNPVANLEATLSGNNLGAEGTKQYLGNLNAGTEGSVDFDLCPEAAGPLSGTITLTYEGADGQIKTVSESFSTTVEAAPVWDDPGIYVDPMPEEKTGLPLWAKALIGLAVCGAVGGGAVVLRRRLKAKKLAQLEDEDEDL